MSIREEQILKKNLPLSRKEKAVLTRNKIYNSGEQLFDQHGFEKVSVDDIVKHAGVAKGSFYVHFESKDALISILVNDYVGKIDMDYQAFLDNLPDDTNPSEIILMLVGKIADVIVNEIGHEHMTLLYKTQLGQDPNTKAAMNYNRQLYKIFYDILHKGKQQKVFRPELSEEETARQLMTIYRGLTYEWCIRHPEFDLKAQALEVFSLVLCGLKN